MSFILQMLLVFGLIIAGAYIYYTNSIDNDDPQFTQIQLRAQRNWRYFGIFLVLSGIGLFIYFYYYTKTSVSANMRGRDVCEICDNYGRRIQNLQPFETSDRDLMALKNMRDSCHKCADETLKMAEGAKKLELAPHSKDIATSEAEKYVKLAQQSTAEYNRLFSKVASKKFGMYRTLEQMRIPTEPPVDVFPKSKYM